MTEKIGMCILVNDMVCFENMMRLFPKKQMNIDMILVNDTRIGDKKHQISNMIQTYDNVNFLNYKYIKGESIITWTLKNMNLNSSSIAFLQQHILTLKLLIFPYLFTKGYKKVFYNDDDILIINPVLEYLKNNDFSVKHIWFNRYDPKKSKKDLRDFNEFCKIFQLNNFSLLEYRHLTTGNMLFTNYLKMLPFLEKFFNSIILQAIHNNRCGKDKSRNWLLEERFFSFYVHKLESLNKSVKYFPTTFLKIINIKWKDPGPQNIQKIPCVIHTSGQDKHIWYNKFLMPFFSNLAEAKNINSII